MGQWYALLVDLLAAFEHGDEFGEAALTGAGFLRLGAETEEDRVAVGRVEGGEELGRLGVGVKLALEVVRDRGGAGALVGGLPATVGFGRFDLGEASGADRVGGEQGFGLFAVDLRPAAARPTRGEALEEVGLVEAALLAVDPAEAERQVDRLGVGDARLRRPLLGDLQPDAPGLVAALLQPGLELGRAGEEQDREIAWQGQSPAASARRSTWSGSEAQGKKISSSQPTAS
jgi:hypothetical protein